MQMWYSDGTPKLRHIAPPGIFIISTISSQSCQSLVNTSKESIELFECQRKSTCARRVLSQLADGLSVFSHTHTTRPPSSLFDQYCSSAVIRQSTCWPVDNSSYLLKSISRTKREKYNSGQFAFHLSSSCFSNILLTKKDIIIFENVV